MQNNGLTWEQFVEQYKPVTNEIDNNASKDNLMFETFGNELEFVNAADEHYVWTIVHDGQTEEIYPGRRFVNRLGYFITEIPWKDEDKNRIYVMDESQPYPGDHKPKV